MNKKVMLVFGTRPEAIKMAPLVRAFAEAAPGIAVQVCVTGQHREMLDQVLNFFGITADYDLNIMKAGQDLYDVSCAVLSGMKEVLLRAKPDLVLVHGDTTTSSMAALACFYQRIPVGHVEAGLRTHDLYSPWPEEANRQITGRLARYHFAPTEGSRDNLLKEGVSAASISVTGNTVIDALLLSLEKIRSSGEMRRMLVQGMTRSGLHEELFGEWSLGTRRLVLVTGHRRENFGEKFLHICQALKRSAETYPEVDFVYPMHFNPNVRKPIELVFGGGQASANMYFIEPLDYAPFLYLMSLSHIVLTDSGGIQEEAPSLSKPVLVMRDTTERPEAVAAGTVRLVGTSEEAICSGLNELLTDKNAYEKMRQAGNPYGDGMAGKRIVAFIEDEIRQGNL